MQGRNTSLSPPASSTRDSLPASAAAAYEDSRQVGDSLHLTSPINVSEQDWNQRQNSPGNMIGIPSTPYDPDHIVPMSVEASANAYHQWTSSYPAGYSGTSTVAEQYRQQHRGMSGHEFTNSSHHLGSSGSPNLDYPDQHASGFYDPMSRSDSDYSSAHAQQQHAHADYPPHMQHHPLNPGPHTSEPVYYFHDQAPTSHPQQLYHFDTQSPASATSYHSPQHYEGSSPMIRDDATQQRLTTMFPATSSGINIRAPNSGSNKKPDPVRSSSMKRPAPSKSATQPAATSRAKKATGTAARKRQKRTGGEVSDSDSDDEDYSRSGGGGGSGANGGGNNVGVQPTSPDGRKTGACTHCKRLKMKCDFPPDATACKRCKQSGHHCLVEGRKPRSAPNKREYLMAQIRQKDMTIESLLKQLHNPYLATPLSVAAQNHNSSPSDTNNDGDVNAWLALTKKSAVASVHRGDYPSPQYLSPGGTHTLGGDLSDHSGEEHYDTAEEDLDDDLQLPGESAPLGLLANLSLGNGKRRGGSRKSSAGALTDEEADDDNVGVANEAYFLPGPGSNLKIRTELIEKYSAPDIVVHKVVQPADVPKLFQIFYERVNPFIGLLDQALHTPETTFARCPFLFTVVCAVASRFFPGRADMYATAMHFAKHSAANALIDGWKTVELCQAYILLSIYSVPAKRWEEDRSWLYTGLAIRLATDLNLHLATPSKKPANEQQEREMLNRTRVWMICSNLDRSTATQFGKPSTIKEDYINRHSQDWYTTSNYNHPYDIGLCAYASLLKIVASFHAVVFSDPSTVTGLNARTDFYAVSGEHDELLSRYNEEWEVRFQRGTNPEDGGSMFRSTLLPFLVAYNRLVMWSFGFQHAFQRGIAPSDHIFFNKCFESAKAVIINMVDVLAPSGYMRYSPDGHFIFTAFASAFLLKLLRPQFAELLNAELENEIFELVTRVIKTFSGNDIAIDDRHTPKLYARFLTTLLTKVKKTGASAGRVNPDRGSANGILVSSTHQTSSHGGVDNGEESSGINGVSDHNSGMHPAEHGYTGAHHQHQHRQATQSEVTIQVEEPNEAQSRPSWGDYDNYDFSFDFAAAPALAQSEMLAPMMAVENSWSTLLMPGFRTEPDRFGATPAHQPFGGFHQMAEPLR